MLELSRTVRFATNHPAQSPNQTARAESGFSGIPGLRGLGRFEEFVVRCRGTLHPTLSYLIDIKEVDRAVRAVVLPRIQDAFLRAHRESIDPAALLADCTPPLAAELAGRARLHALRWNLSPYQSLEIIVHPASTVLIRQRFEFAASHRLHAPALSPEENRRAFGKCNRESGHGHNYIFEPCVEAPVVPPPNPPHPLAVGALETAARILLDRYDHTYLNVDAPEFDASRGGVIPSVENIARVFFDRLAPEIAALGGRLASMTVWESDRTSATYPAVP